MRIKHRYLLFEIGYLDHDGLVSPMATLPENLSSRELQNIIAASVQLNFGDCGAATAGNSLRGNL